MALALWFFILGGVMMATKGIELHDPERLFYGFVVSCIGAVLQSIVWIGEDHDEKSRD